MKLTCSKCQGTRFKSNENENEFETEPNTKSYECINCGNIEVIKKDYKTFKIKQFHIEVENNGGKSNKKVVKNS
jgi:Zn finger protein HypA/HybF involved in hydrogenase expression